MKQYFFRVAPGKTPFHVGTSAKEIGFTDFCMKHTRGSVEGLRRCTKCDNTCTGTYFCHAGLMDFSIDIKVGDIFLGKIIGGQVLPCEPDEEKFRNIASELGINPDVYIEALNKVVNAIK